MKVVILAGGMGTRLGTVSSLKPKPMVEIGGKPILWHIMKIYSFHGFNEFVICLGYKGHVIKDYFKNFLTNNADFTIDTSSGSIRYETDSSENWKVTLVDTGLKTLKGGRIKKIEKYLDSDTNLLTYGDGVADIKLDNILQFHKSHGKIITVSGVRPPSMFGELVEKDGEVLSFEEKPQTSKGLINGGFMVFNKELFSYLEYDGDFEFGPMETLAKERQVMTYKHLGFWECADTVRDIEHLNKLWETDKATWKVW